MRSHRSVLGCVLAALVLGVAPAALAAKTARFVFDFDPLDIADGPAYNVTGSGLVDDLGGCDFVVMVMVDATGKPTDVDTICIDLLNGQGNGDGDYGEGVDDGYVPTLGPVTYALFDINEDDVAALTGINDSAPEFFAYVVANGRCLAERFLPVDGVPVGTPFTLCRKPAIGTGAGPGGGPHARSVHGEGVSLLSFLAYDPNFTGGTRVALGDVNGDGVPDLITGAGPGGGPHVRVFDGATGAELRSFFAYDAAFTGGVFVAAGDVNGDGKADIITGAGPGGGPHVRVFDGATGAELRSFFAYDAAF